MKRIRGGSLLTILIFFLIIIVLLYQFRNGVRQPEIITINELSEMIKSGDVIRLIVDDSEVVVVFQNGDIVFSTIDPDKTITEQLYEFGLTSADLSPDSVQVEIRDPGRSSRNLVLGAGIGGLVGLIIGAALMKFYIESRSTTPAQ